MRYLESYEYVLHVLQREEINGNLSSWDTSKVVDMSNMFTNLVTEPFSGIVHFQKPPPLPVSVQTHRTGDPAAATAKLACSYDELGTGAAPTKHAALANTYPKTGPSLQTKCSSCRPSFTFSDTLNAAQCKNLQPAMQGSLTQQTRARHSTGVQSVPSAFTTNNGKCALCHQCPQGRFTRTPHVPATHDNEADCVLPPNIHSIFPTLGPTVGNTTVSSRRSFWGCKRYHQR